MALYRDNKDVAQSLQLSKETVAKCYNEAMQGPLALDLALRHLLRHLARNMRLMYKVLWLFLDWQRIAHVLRNH